jgi:hypothetical protein
MYVDRFFRKKDVFNNVLLLVFNYARHWKNIFYLVLAMSKKMPIIKSITPTIMKMPE